MNEEALIKHRIYGQLTRLSEEELNPVDDFIGFLQFQKDWLPKKKNIRFQGSLAKYHLDSSDINKIRIESWKHLVGEFENK